MSRARREIRVMRFANYLDNPLFFVWLVAE